MSNQLLLKPCYLNMDTLHPETGREYFFLNGEITRGNAEEFLSSLCLYNQLTEKKVSMSETAQLLPMESEPAMGGGLAIFKNDFSLFPGCCSGLEDWREWYNLKPGGSSGPWLGHDPNAWIDTLQDKVIIYADEHEDADQIAFGYDELASALEKADNAIQEAFAKILEYSGSWELYNWLMKWLYDCVEYD